MYTCSLCVLSLIRSLYSPLLLWYCGLSWACIVDVAHWYCMPCACFMFDPSICGLLGVRVWVIVCVVLQYEIACSCGLWRYLDKVLHNVMCMCSRCALLSFCVISVAMIPICCVYSTYTVSLVWSQLLRDCIEYCHISGSPININGLSAMCS